ncbi:MAG: ribosome rescue protein RqcH [Thermoproteota archaeon]|nr:ribosome rescue protein RqcH [Thermoproteota archaeon]
MVGKEITSFDIAALIPEVNQAVRNAYIRNIYQLNYTTLLLKLHQPNQPPLHLLIEAGKRLHLTAYSFKKPKKPPSFCMALRKYLRNGKIVEVQQHEFDRIVLIKVEARGEAFQLVLELFGQGNIVLVNSENKILHALTYRKMRDRNILRGENFQHPPSTGKNPFKLTRQELDKIKSFGGLEVVKALTRLLSISGFYAEEILLRAGVDKNTSCQSLEKQDIDQIFYKLQQILSSVRSEVTPCVVVNKQGEWVDVTPISLKKYSQFERKKYKTLSEALDEFYMRTTAEEEVAQVFGEIDRERKKHERMLKEQQEALRNEKQKMEWNKKVGEIIYLHFHELKALFRKILGEKQTGKTWKEIIENVEKEKKVGETPAIHFHSLDPKKSILYISIRDLTFPLNLRRSVQENAGEYYERSKKAEKKLEGAKKALKQTQSKIKQLEHHVMEKTRKSRKPPRKRRKKAWYEKFRWFHSSNNFLIIGGRDAATNEILIKKYLEPEDIIFHAEFLGSPFVIIKTGGKTVPEQTMKEAAQLTASYSRSWREMLSVTNVYWVHPEQVSKTPPSGQYLKKGAFMIRGKKNYLRNVPLKVAIGIKVEKERVLVVGGPPEAIASQTNIYIEIVPGEEKSSKLAKKLRRIWAEKASEKLRKHVLEIRLEEIQRFIPSGRGRIC